MKDLVLVTGISGYIARHVAHILLSRGYQVRGTVRSIAKADGVKKDLADAGTDVSHLSFIEADLESDDNWSEAVKDCAYIQHIASPFPLEQPSDREALVPAARAGAQRVLAAGFAQNVKRVVMTSSMVSMMGKPGKGPTMDVTEDDWTQPSWRPLTAYAVSKTKAELSAWEYAKVQGFEDKLTVINPGLVLGPAIGTSFGASLHLIEQMFAGELPRAPKVAYPIVDVRDVAELHVEAMLKQKSKGRRLIAASNTLWLKDIAAILRQNFPEKAKKTPKGEIPNFVVRMVSLFDDRIKAVVADLGVFHTADTSYVTNITGVNFRPAEESIIDTAQFLIDCNRL
ncbi:MAG: NAD-dependent epimerase/dehydratase family protein [Hyphomonadaceae bacterium]|nr:NAD-dependent epimerase/dehydratase family protein [Hyphomonadaceae bacterium]